MNVKLLTECHLVFLSLKVGCTGSSESTLIKMPHCWKSHAHGLQSRPPSPKRAERKVRRRPFREAGSGQNNGTR